MDDFVGYRGFYQSVSIDEHSFIQATHLYKNFIYIVLVYTCRQVCAIDPTMVIFKKVKM